MAYTKTNWTETTEITIARLNNLETQYEKALVDARAASGNPLYAEIVNGKGSPGTKGRLVFDLVDNNFYVDNGSVWIKASPTQRTGHVTAQGSSISGTTLRLRPPQGYYPGDSGNSVQLSDANWIAENIRSDISIFGLTGTLHSPTVLFPNTTWVNGPNQGSSNIRTIGGLITLQLRDPYGGTVSTSVRTASKINLTPFNTLRVSWQKTGYEPSGPVHWLYGRISVPTTADNDYSDVILQRSGENWDEVNTVDISDITGDRYVMLTGRSDADREVDFRFGLVELY